MEMEYITARKLLIASFLSSVRLVLSPRALALVPACVLAYTFLKAGELGDVRTGTAREW